MNIEKLHNTTVNLPDREVKPGEVIENVQICPIGDFPNGDHQQHCTAEALQNVVRDWTERGSKEILVDFEHNSESHEPNSDTSAAAWVSNVRVDPERGLIGDFKLTDVGAQAISNRRLRFLSVSWFVNRETREPIRITSIALTNKPNIPVDPVLNKEGEVEEIENVTDANGLSHGEDGKFDGGNGSAGGKKYLGETEPEHPKKRLGEKWLGPEGVKAEKQYKHDKTVFSYRHSDAEKRKRMRSNATALGIIGDFKDDFDAIDRIKNKEGENMDKIKEALGLAPEATEEQVLEAITAMVKANKDAEDAALEKEAEDFAEKNSKKCNKDVLKAQYIANKDVAKALVAGIPDSPAAPQKVLNKSTAKTPDGQTYVELQRNKAIGDYRAAHPGCTFSSAWGACRQANPELFQ